MNRLRGYLAYGYLFDISVTSKERSQMKIPFYQIDAFTSSVFGGNPAAVCPLDDWIPDDLMQKIAMENNLSETAFFVRKDDHFHIRFYCSPDDIAEGCRDMLPIYPWHEAKLAEHGVRVRLAGPRRKPGPKLTSVAQAARKAARKYGPFHPDVTAFLERRKAWVAKPHPGRPYCP